MTPNDSQIRSTLRTLVQDAAPTAIVFPRWELGYNPVEWPGLIRSSNDNDRAHGWVITRRAIDAEKNGQRCPKRDYVYAVWGFHYYLTGDDATNSEDLFQAEVDAVCATLDTDLKTAHPELRLIEPIGFQLDLYGFGGELLHVAQGRLVVQPCC